MKKLIMPSWIIVGRERKLLEKVIINKQKKECCKTWARFWIENVRKFKCDGIEFYYCGGCGKKIRSLTERDIDDL